MPFEIVRNDITRMQVDAIVNAADSLPCVNAGVDAAIHKKAGTSLLEARKKIGYIQPGTAAITPAFDLDAAYVIHAATPVWIDGLHGEIQLLQQTYEMCLNLAVQNNCDSIAFPLLSSGNHGFPQGKALQAAIHAFSNFLLEQEMQIYLVVFGNDSLKLSEKLVHHVACYIDENYIDDYDQEILGGNANHFRKNRYTAARKEAMQADCMMSPCASVHLPTSGPGLDAFMKKKDAGFTETLLSLIQKSGQKNAAVYKKANISKQHFSKLINDPHAKPSKQTAVALALALELNLDDTIDLISRAGYTLNRSSDFDLIIRYFIDQRQYNVIMINMTLYEFDQPLLGS